MSVRSVVDFWRSVQTNPELQAKLAKLGGADPSVGGAEIARAAGFEVTAEELRDVDQVVAFWDRVESDDRLRQKLAPAHASETPELAMREISRIAKEAGFELAPEALQVVTGALVSASTGRLSEAQLDAVAGGAPPPPNRPSGSSLDKARDNKWQAPPKVGPGVVGAKP